MEKGWYEIFKEAPVSKYDFTIKEIQEGLERCIRDAESRRIKLRNQYDAVWQPNYVSLETLKKIMENEQKQTTEKGQA